MRLSTRTLCLALMGFVASVTAISREPSHRDVAHIIKSRQAHVPKAKAGELLRKRTLNMMNSFQQAQTDVETHTREIKRECASVQQGANKVLPGFLSHVKQMSVHLDSTSPAGEVDPLGLADIFPGVALDQ
ncbi:hypothetical protein RQP46_000622 [Phenoliferia psychrophenolica]